jgi:hypothetical protein
MGKATSLYTATSVTMLPPQGTREVLLVSGESGTAWNDGENAVLPKKKELDQRRDFEQQLDQRGRAIGARMPLPGKDTAERNRWIEFAKKHPEQYLDFLFERHHPGQKTKTSIGILAPPAKIPDTFRFCDWKNSNFKGLGPQQLTTYVRYRKHPDAPDLVPIEEAFWTFFQSPEQYRARPLPAPYHNKQKNEPFRWSIIAEGFLDEMERRPPAVPPFKTNYWHVLDLMRQFYDYYQENIMPAAANRAKAGAPVTEETRKENRCKIAQMYNESVAIRPGNLGHQYLRQIRKLVELNDDLLEHSPFVRFHPALSYKIKPPSDGSGGVSQQGIIRFFPAVLCFCAHKDRIGEWVAVQRIYLDPKNAQKLTFEDGGKYNKPKLSKGLLRAEDAMFFVQPGRLEILPIVFLCEGPETAWSVASISRLFCVYASFGVGNFGRFMRHKDTLFKGKKPLICLCIDRVKDNEEKQAEADRQTMQQVDSLTAAGWRTVLLREPDVCCKV